MPFHEARNTIYKELIKPTIELPEFNLVCKRADELNTTNLVIQDIWKQICEARIIIADVTGFNPNVMYELGIAHTVGKTTIIIHQEKKTDTMPFPFDISPIRRIIYKNSATGRNKLREKLQETLKNILLSPITI